MALALVPDALRILAAPHRVVLVSGTNGKTTTTALLARALTRTGSVLSNADGANLASGLVSTLLRSPAAGWVVLEVDEVALPKAIKDTEPELIVLLNLSRDQLDRTTEVGDHVLRWAAALRAAPAPAIIANADDALIVTAVLGARPEAHAVTWVQAGKPYRLDSALCPRCGSSWDPHEEQWRCLACGLHRPAAGYSLSGDGLVRIDSVELALPLELPGRANTSNALMALVAARTLGVDVDTGLASMRSVEQVEGRYAELVLGARHVQLLLAKNPAGWAEALDQLQHDGGPILIAVNARSADGLDPSWLWDVDFEQLRGRHVIVSGERAWDLAVRLAYAEVPHHVEHDLMLALEGLPDGPGSAVANYTAFQSLRRLIGPSG
ncbi:MAG: hypothetical protein JWO12_2851 [Frankiales bacterium]|nr:hypothetical protein [Frankiales bacterium]